MKTRIHTLHKIGGKLGESVKVAILDSGINREHPHFRNIKIVAKDFCNPETGLAIDLIGHGSHCAGIITQIAPASTLLVGLTMNSFFSYDPLIAGIKWAMGQAADIICICSGGDHRNPKLLKMIMKAARKEIIIVAAIGNDGRTGEGVGCFPAQLPQVLAVGSLNNGGDLARFTNMNPEVNLICCPGVRIRSAWLGNEYKACSGTSVSAAYMSGVLALLISQWKKRRYAIRGDKIRKKVFGKALKKLSGRGVFYQSHPDKLLRTKKM